MGRRAESVPRKRADGQEIFKKVPNIIYHQGNADHNHNEIIPHADGYYKKGTCCYFYNMSW